MQIQKFYYFSAGQHIAEHNETISSHHFQVWPHGPVLPSLYGEFARYGDQYIGDYTYFEGDIFYYSSGEIFNTITSTLGILGNYTAWQLSDKSHIIDGPWHKTLTDKKQYKVDISWDMIKKYFKENPVVQL